MSEKDRSLFIPILHRPLFSWSGVLINSLENSLTLSRMNHMNPRIEAEIITASQDTTLLSCLVWALKYEMTYIKRTKSKNIAPKA